MGEPSASEESTTPSVKKSVIVRTSPVRPVGMPLLWIVLAITMSAACAHHLTGSKVRLWRLRGRVVAMTEDTLDVRHKSGQVVRISLDDHTEYYLNRNVDSRQSVHRDTRVTIDVETTTARGNRARRIDVFR